MDDRIKAGIVIAGIVALGIIFRPDPPELAYRSPETVRGTGISDTRSFDLLGDYVVDWDATPHSDVGCYHGATLRHVDGRRVQTLVGELLDEAAHRQTNVYGVPQGTYYVNVSSGCDWVFRFLPVER